QPLSGDDLLARLAAALCRATRCGEQCPAAPGAYPAPGGNSQLAGGAHGGCRSHRELAGAALGLAARKRLRRIARGSRGNRAAAGRIPLAAFSRPLPAATALPGGAAICNSFWPTACRSCRSKTQTPNQDQNQTHPLSRSPLEETLEADISTWQKTGHFYFALTASEGVGYTGGKSATPPSVRLKWMRFANPQTLRLRAWQC